MITKKIWVVVLLTGMGIASKAQFYVQGGVNLANITQTKSGQTQNNNMLTTFNAGILGRFNLSTVLDLESGLLLAGSLFMIGLVGVLIRRNIIFMLLSVEIMLNAAGLAFIVAGSKWAQPDGQVMFIFILTMAAAEVSVGLALILQIYHQLKTLDSDEANKMKG